MNEDEVRSALRNVMVASSPPPPMDTGSAVEAGQRAHRRRRATRAGVVAGLAVVGIAVGTTFLPTALTGGGPVEAASGPPSTTEQTAGSASAPASASASAPGSESASTKTPWPNGQTDRTATNGPRAAKSVDLVPKLAAALPSGLTVQDTQEAKTWSQSQFEDYAEGGGEVWEYLARVPVVKTDGSGRVGTLYTEITTAGNTFPSGPCEVTERSWGIKGTCQVVDVGGKQVGLLTSDGTGDQKTFDQLAAYRYPDGTVVFVAQAKTSGDSALPALDGEPLTETQLATLATDPKFHLD